MSLWLYKYVRDVRWSGEKHAQNVFFDARRASPAAGEPGLGTELRELKNALA